MAHHTQKAILIFIALILPTLVASDFVSRADDTQQMGSDRRVTGASQDSIARLDPTAFVVVDIQPSEGDSIFLSWSDLGSNFVYTVEFTDSLTEENWSVCVPIDEWPTDATSWTDTSTPASGTRFYRIRTEALYDPPAAPGDVSAGIEEDGVVIRWTPVPGASSYNVYWSMDEELLPTGATKIEDVSSPFTHSGLDVGVTYYYVVTAVGNKGESAVSSVVSVMVSPPLDRTVATAMHAMTEFLYTGDNPIQTGVAEGMIEPVRVAVLRGKVLTRDGEPLSGVTITVLNHPEYGQTLSRGDGMFDIAVNGGGHLTVNYQKDGYLRAQRRVQVPWQEFASLPDAIMIVTDSLVTEIDFSEPMQSAQGGPMTDDCGTRRAAVLFPEGTQAEIVLPDGSTQPVDRLNVRATEYSVGENGPQAMPAELPPTSAYTYCVELTADEAVAKVNGRDVVFNQPVYFYVENFLDAEVGSNVPLGYYDNDRGVWVPTDSGRVIEILDVTGALADLDVDGDGSADTGQALSDLGITDAEREKLANLYSPGQSLWRMPISHFSTWDCNWGFSPPDDAEFPDTSNLENFPRDPEKDPCVEEGSYIECQNQVLGEDVPIVGTPFRLHYQSDRVQGNKVANTLEIPLSGPTVPDSLTGIKLEITVAGRKFTHYVGSDHPCLLQQPTLQAVVPGSSGATAPLADPGDLLNQSYTFTWDGKDGYGRMLQGSQPVTVRIGYVYCGLYKKASRFGYSMGELITGSRTRQDLTLWQTWQGWIGGAWDSRAESLGGWTLDEHHVYDPGAQMFYGGDGSRRNGRQMNKIETRMVVTSLDRVRTIVAGPDGSVYFSASRVYIKRLNPDGSVQHVVGLNYKGDNDVPDIALGPDGSVYWVESRYYLVRKRTPQGTITTVAGNGQSGYSGDGGPAIEASLLSPVSVDVGPDGSIYIADRDNKRIRSVAPDGTISTIAGNGQSTVPGQGDGGPAIEAPICLPVSVAVGRDGSVYFLEGVKVQEGLITGCRVRRVGPDGIISTVAGMNQLGFSGDGGPATSAKIDATDLVIGPDGSVYIAGMRNGRVRVVAPSGTISTIAGMGKSPIYEPLGDGGPAAQAALAPWDVALAPDGSLYIADNHLAGDTDSRFRRVSPALPGYSIADIVVAAEDGSEVYIFDNAGRHLRTLDALTGAAIYNFTYDSAGRLALVEDGDGNITTIERDVDGNPTAIVAPYGQRTVLSIDADGYLASITNPAGEQVQLIYLGDGLLETFTDPRRSVYRFTYDALGRLTREEDPAGGSLNLARVEFDNAYEVAVKTALDRTTTYRVERLSTGGRRLTNTFVCGAQTQLSIGTDGSYKMTSADGTAIDLIQGPDPRWGMQAPVASNATGTTPGGRRLAVGTSRDVSLTDPNSPLSLKTFSETLSINGRAYSSVYDAGNRTFTDTTPEGRQNTATLDAQGRVTEVQEAGLAPTSYTYDTNGRLTSITSGAGAEARTISLSYSDDGYLATITDPLGQTTSFAYDAAGRVTAQTRPDTEIIQFNYDANGNVTSITPPGRPAHTFTYTAVDLLSTYTAPDVGAGSNQAVYTYDADGQVTGITRADGQAVGCSYDDAGRLSTLTLPRGQVAYSYDATTGQLHAIITPDGGTLSYDYDGPLLAAETWTGAVAGGVTYTYDNDFRITSVSVNGDNTIAFQYNQDSELTQVGELAVTRDPQNGLVTGTAVGSATETWGYNSFGEPVSHNAAHNTTNLYAVQYTRDKLGRITEKTETISGVSDIFNYAYDAAGRLVEVKKNDTAIATYDYDSNGNRLSHTGASGTVSGAYDDQDRLLQYGATTYTYTPNGDLLTKTSAGQTTTYEHDALGNLIAVTLGDGTEIEYLVDGENRRIGKKVNGALVQGFLYLDQVNPIAELDGAGNVVSLFVYATRANVPAYMVKESTAYCIISDHLGSPRFVVNTGTGEIVQRMDYDEFGNVTLDTNPGFQPFGFAGGIYDRHTELVRFGARDYDAQTGRWTSHDPLLFEGGQNSLYVYVDNDPINRTDPLGTGWIDDLLNRLKRIASDSADEARKAAEEAAKQRRPPPPPKPTPRKPIPKDFRGTPGGSWGLRCLYPWIIIDPQLLNRWMCEKISPTLPGCPPSSYRAWRERQTS